MTVVIALVLMALATSGRSQEPETVQVFEEGDAVAAPNEVNGRTFGSLNNFLAYKENLLHNKISFLFSLVPRPNRFPPPYAGGIAGFGGFPFQGIPGAAGIPPGYPAPPGMFGPAPGFGGIGVAPGIGAGFYPGFNNPFYPPGSGFMPGILPVVSENNTGNNPAGKPPSSSASVAVTQAASALPAATTAAPTPSSSGDGDAAAAAETEETKRQQHKTIKMMPKSFKMNG